MKMTRRCVGAILVAAVLITLVSSATLIDAQQQTQASQSDQAHRFLAVATQARDTAYALRTVVLETQGSLPDEIDDLLADADSLLAGGNVSTAVRAMNLYRQAYRQLHRFLEQQGVDPEVPERARGLLAAINRTCIRIERYNATLTAINETLTNEQYVELQDYVAWVLGNLTEAKTSLALANESLWLSPPNVVWAAHNLTEANHHLQDALYSLRQIAKARNRWRMEHFLTYVWAFRERIRERFRERQGLFEELLEALGYANISDFHQSIDGLTEHARDHVDDMHVAIHDLHAIMAKLQAIDHAFPGPRGPP